MSRRPLALQDEACTRGLRPSQAVGLSSGTWAARATARVLMWQFWVITAKKRKGHESVCSKERPSWAGGRFFVARSVIVPWPSRTASRIQRGASGGFNHKFLTNS